MVGLRWWNLLPVRDAARQVRSCCASLAWAAALAAERAGYDAFALGCFYDPALTAVRSLVDIPCLGLSESCMLVACSLGQRFGLVSLEASQRAQ